MNSLWVRCASGAVASLAIVAVALAPALARAQYEEAPPPAGNEDPYAPPPEDLTTKPNEPLTEGAADPYAPPEEEQGSLLGEPAPTTAPSARKETGPLIDGRLREGAFLSGPGSLTFVLHHSAMGFLGGFSTQFLGGFRDGRPSFELGAREAMLAGTLVGAGIGFGASAWYQFNNWIGLPAANFGIVNSVISGMALTGLVDLMTNDALALAWVAFLGAEAGAWVTAVVGGGDFTVNKGLFIASGGGWGLAYCALLLGVLGTSGSSTNVNAAVDALLIAPGIGAGALALAAMKYSPTTNQILRADAFGAGVGAGVLLLSGAFLGGFSQPTPYVLSMLGSAGAIAAVSLLWEESAEGPPTAIYLKDVERDRPYASAWW